MDENVNRAKASPQGPGGERPAPWLWAVHPGDRDRAWEVVLFGARVQPGDED